MPPKQQGEELRRNSIGDGIYGCRWITNLVAGNHATPYFLPRSNVTFKSKEAVGWYDMLFSLWKDPQKWLEKYHMRSISETVNSMVKCRFGAPLRKRFESRKETETWLKLVAHDILRVGYIEILAGVGIGASVNFVPKPPIVQSNCYSPVFSSKSDLYKLFYVQPTF